MFKKDNMAGPLLPLSDELPRNCTFEEADWKILASHWHPIALIREVGAGPFKAKLLDTPLVIYRSGGELIVANDICPHRGVPLSMGKHDGAGIVCAYHGLHFGEGGKCDHVPASPDKKIPQKLNLQTYPVRQRYGLVWTCLRPSNDAAGIDIGPMPYWEEEGFQQINCPWIDIYGFAGRQVEGFLDVAHFGFVHTETFGEADNTVVPAYTPEFHSTGFEVYYRSTVSNYSVGFKHLGPPGYEWLRHFNVHLPFTATLIVHFPGDGKLVIMNAASPVSAKHTRLFVPIARNFDTDMPVQNVYDFNRKVFEEDKAIVEAQMPECLPLDPKMEAHIPADRSSVAYRTGLRNMGLSRIFIS